jgi:ribosomal protein S18 acetylase RimI-like enzyme
MTVPVAALQAYLREVAALQYETVALPGLSLFVHPDDDLTFFNYAIPGPDWAECLDGSLARLRAECAARARRPRFEFIAEYAPGLKVALRAAGFIEEARQHLMVCTAETARTVPSVPGLEIAELDADAPLAELQALLGVQRRGFGPDQAEDGSEAEARQFARMLGEGRAYLARLAGQAVAAGTTGAPLEIGPAETRAAVQIAELNGLATLAPYRRRGIAGAVTAYAVQSALARGVDLICLVAADARAGRVYERVGFCARATMLAYLDGQERN